MIFRISDEDKSSLEECLDWKTWIQHEDTCYERMGIRP